MIVVWCWVPGLICLCKECTMNLLTYYLGVAPVALLISTCCAMSINLTSQPGAVSGQYCSGPVNFTCVATEIDTTLFWDVNGSSVASYTFRDEDIFPRSMALISPTGVSHHVINASSDTSFRLNVESVLSVDNVSVFNEETIFCTGRFTQSDALTVSIRSDPAVPPSANCSFLSSSGGHEEVFFWWSPSFTSQYAVERYRVSVNPDPSSCSSDQVSPNENYSCSGLVLGTHYTFTVSAINCGDQEGESIDQLVIFNRPAEPVIDKNLETVETQEQQYYVQWGQSSLVSKGCSIEGDVDYIVELVGNTGEVLEQRVVTSDSCSNGTCSIMIPLRTCLVTLQATSLFGNSTVVGLNIAGIRLTTTNQALLVVGVILFSVALLIAVILIILIIMVKKGSKVLYLFLVIGCSLIVLSLVLWVAVGFQVGLQGNTCDPGWQSTRDALIIAAHVISDLALVLIVVATIFLFATFWMKSSAHSNKDCWSLSPRAGAGAEVEKEPLGLVMEEKRHVQRGAGGRVEEYEGAQIMVDEFAAVGEQRRDASTRVGEKLFQQYDGKLKEHEAQYDTTTHVKTPKEATPTQPSTYSQLNKSKEGEKADEGKEGGDYEHLDHKKGKSKDGVNNHKTLPPTEEYGKLKTAPPPPRSPARGPMTSSKKKTERSLQGGGSTAEPGPGARDKSEAEKEYKKYAKDGKMDLILDDTHLVRIAETFDEDWDTTVAPALGLTPDEIERIKKDYKKKPGVQKQQALQVWKKRKEQNATNGNLLRLFLTCEKRAYAYALSELLS